MMDEEGTALRPSRRQLVRSVGVVGAMWLLGCGRVQLPGQAGPSTRVPRVGFLSPFEPGGRNAAALQQGLQELGYVEGKTIAIDYRSGAGNRERLPALAQELVALPVDVIVATGAAVRAGR